MTKKKIPFSEQDKVFIHAMKDTLQTLGVPKDQWSKLIQKELTEFQKNNRNNPYKFFSKLKEKITNIIAAKKMGMGQADMMNLFGNAMQNMSGEDKQFMDSLFGGLMNMNFDNVNLDDEDE